MKVLGYVRVSTNDQADSGLGLEAQRSALTEECARRGWELAGILEDAGLSGKSLDNRPALQEALSVVEARSRDATGIVVTRLDRLTRSLLDFAGLLDRARTNKWNLVALDLGIDLSTPAGEFLASVMAAAAQWERRIIGQRTREALAVKRGQGVRLGRPPSISLDVVEIIRLRHAGGAGYAAIAGELNAAGVPTARGGQRWHDTTVRKVLLTNSRTRD